MQYDGRDLSLNYDSPRELREFLERRGIALKKRWGQNFMVSRAARERLVSLLAPVQGERVWEIGPGLGSMTELLVARGASLLLFEVDWAFVHYLAARFSDREKVDIVAGDFLKTWRDHASPDGLPDAVFGNLPYRAAATIIGDLLEKGAAPSRMVVTVQKEVALRMAARASTPEYSGFSVLCQAFCVTKYEGALAPGAFYPPPAVQSAAVTLERRWPGHPSGTAGDPGNRGADSKAKTASARTPSAKTPAAKGAEAEGPAPQRRGSEGRAAGEPVTASDDPPVADPPLLAALVRMLFAARRKTMLNNVRSHYRASAAGHAAGRAALPASAELVTAAAEDVGIDLRQRAEELPPRLFVRLANRVSDLGSPATGR